jgi:hypothetical protein
MKVLLRSRSLAAGGLLALALAALIPATAAAKPEPGARPRGFRLFARSLGAITVNRVYLGLNSAKGNIGVDSSNSSTIGGGFWPKGSGNQFVFNSGLQVAGKVDNPGGAWDGDVTGAFFFDPKGNTEHGSNVQNIYNFQNPADAGAWPDAARVPVEINEADNFYNPILRGLASASQGDVWFVTWDGDPTLRGGRPHPLGVAVESRGLAWNYPTGNEDIVYFTFSFYNVTASDPNVYSGVRPAIRPIMQQLGAQFVSSNSSAFRVVLPAGGYAIDSLFSAFAADMDVSNAGSNFCSVNIPFALGFCYEHTFTFDPTSGEQYDDPTIWGPPFFGGPGFVGVKYLRSPTGAGEIQLFSNTINSATGFRDPQNVFQLFRYLSGNLSTALGDQVCNVSGGRAVGICFINPSADDARFYQSSTALNLQPGAFGSIVVAYIFAAPVAIPGFAPSGSTDITPGNPVLLTNSALLTLGANTIDSLTGFNGYNDFESPDTVTQKEFTTIPGSLLDKALKAQIIFDNGFLLPFAPTTPNFYLIPGDNSVSIVWQPSASEVQGDPYYVVASNPGTPTEPNLLYDPNYRQYDVEGYRIYRGRVDNSGSLTLVAQFDYAGTQMNDFTGQIQPVSTCAPELGVTLACGPDGDPGPYFDYVPLTGVPATVSVAYPLVGQFIQVKLGSASRVVVNPGQVPGDLCVTGSCALVIGNADTLLTSTKNGAYPQLSDNGVPFGYIDREPKNNFRYFYSVTAFDVNSFQSGPSSLESPRVARPVTPSVTASNAQAPQLVSALYGQSGTALNVNATFDIDAATGRFNGTPPATNGVSGAFAPLIPALLPALNLTATIDSVNVNVITSAECGGVANSFDTCYVFYVTFSKDGVNTQFTTVTAWPMWSGFDPTNQLESQLGAQPVNIDPTAAARYGIPGTVTGSAAVGVTQRQYIQFSSFEGQAARRGLISNNTAALCGTSLTNCQTAVSAGGSRWFEGPNETLNHPAVSIKVGGGLTGVDTVWAPIHHVQRDPLNPTVPGSTTNNGTIQFWGYGLAGVTREADVVFTWGTGGKMASVVDVTHDVPVRFSTHANSTWGFVPDADGSGSLNWQDFAYAPNAADYWAYEVGALGPTDVADSVPYDSIAVPIPVSTSFATADGSSTGTGIGIYVNGERYIFELTGGVLPPPGTKWTLRTYSGIVRVAAGDSAAGTLAAGTTPTGYTFTPVVRSPAVPGLQVKFTVTEPTATLATTNLDLRRVHTVPDPYYVTNGYEATTESKVLQFVNLPTQAIIRIYTSSGILVQMIEHNSTDFSGAEAWNLRNRNNQVVASGVYFYMIEAGDARRVGRFTVVNFAQ